MRLYHWLLIVIGLIVLAVILSKPALYFVAGIILLRVLYAAIEKNKIKTCPPEEVE
jgi:hypothetical protein